MTPLVFGFGLAFGLAAWRTVPPLTPTPRGAFVLMVLLGLVLAYLAGRRRRQVPVTATATAVAVATSTSSASGGAVNVYLGGTLDQLDRVSWRQGAPVDGQAVVDAELAELDDDAVDQLDPAELLELSPGDRERVAGAGVRSGVLSTTRTTPGQRQTVTMRAELTPNSRPGRD